MIAAAAFAVAAVGLWLLLVPASPPALLRLVDGSASDPGLSPVGTDPMERIGRWAARFGWGDWLRGRVKDRDLEVIGRSAEAHLGAKVVLAGLGAVVPILLVAGLAAVGLRVVLVVPVWLALLLGVTGFFVPDIQRASAAASERQDLRDAVEDFAEMTAYGFRAGSNVATALDGAARRLRGRFGDEVSRVLTEAQLAGDSPWAALNDLGERLGVADLCEVAAAVEQAGTDGASVAASLEAKATGLARRALAEREAAAAPATSRMLVRSIALSMCALALLYGPLLLRVRHV